MADSGFCSCGETRVLNSHLASREAATAFLIVCTQDKDVTGPSGYEYGFYCSKAGARVAESVPNSTLQILHQEWVDALSLGRLGQGFFCALCSATLSSLQPDLCQPTHLAETYCWPCRPGLGDFGRNGICLLHVTARHSRRFPQQPAGDPPLKPWSPSGA